MCIIFGLSLREKRMTIKGFRNTSVSLVICIIVGEFKKSFIYKNFKQCNYIWINILVLIFPIPRYSIWYPGTLYQYVSGCRSVPYTRDVRQVSWKKNIYCTSQLTWKNEMPLIFNVWIYTDRHSVIMKYTTQTICILKFWSKSAYSDHFFQIWQISYLLLTAGFIFNGNYSFFSDL